MSETEKFAVWPLLLEPKLESTKSTRHDSIVERGMNRITCQNYMASRSLKNKLIRPRSNILARFFSVSEHALINWRRGVLPSTFQAQFFLYMNPHVWGVEKVRELVNDTT